MEIVRDRAEGWAEFPFHSHQTRTWLLCLCLYVSFQLGKLSWLETSFFTFIFQVPNQETRQIDLNGSHPGFQISISLGYWLFQSTKQRGNERRRSQRQLIRSLNKIRKLLKGPSALGRRNLKRSYVLIVKRDTILKNILRGSNLMRCPLFSRSTTLLLQEQRSLMKKHRQKMLKGVMLWKQLSLHPRHTL